MPFEARSLRVQLPCGSVTVIDGEKYEAKARARKSLRELVTRRLETSPTPCCARATGDEDCFRGSQDLGALTDRLCMGTDDVTLRTVVHASALPELREQLEARLRDVRAAEEAVARAVEGDAPDA